MGKDFVKVARTDEIKPGTMSCVEIRGRRILLANVDGEFYATDDTCTHEDASLSDGSLHGELVTCPLHGSRFSVRTGSALEEPAEEDLKSYAVRVEGDAVLVGFD